MTPKEEYLQGIKDLDEAYQIEKKKLIYEYAKNVNPYKQGDIILDHIGYGEVVSYRPGFSIGTETPDIVYKCRVLNKDKKLPKKMEYRDIWMSNIKSEK